MTTWTGEKLDAAVNLWKAGATAAQIAATVGVTRNAVLGVSVRRRDLFPERMPSLATMAKVSEAKARMVRQRIEDRDDDELAEIHPSRSRVEFMPGLDSLAGSRPIERVALRTPGEPIPLLLLTEQTCKWPMPESRRFNRLFCGAEKHPAGSYCTAHAKLAYTPRTVSRGQRPTLNP